MRARWLIVADDLTGAADSAIAFARRGLCTKVLLHADGFIDDETVVASFDADSRRLAAADAATRHASALRRYAAPGLQVFKKIDSTLRGNPAAEIAAMRGVLAEHQRPTLGVMAPAFPAMGRTTREGRVFVHGRPLEESETWKREHAYPTAELARILEGAGVGSVHVPLACVRRGAEAVEQQLREAAQRRSSDGLGVIAVCDAETDDDLDHIAMASRPPPGVGFVIGTAGLAHALARTLPVAARSPSRPFSSNARSSSSGALVVVGSLASVSREAARRVAAMSRVVHLRIGPDVLLRPERQAELRFARDSAIEVLNAGDDVLVEIEADGPLDPSLGPEIARALAGALADVMACASGIVVTGGETAKALLSRHHVHQVELFDEIEDGLVLGIAQRDTRVPLITKSGAFGNEYSLVRALEKLRMIRITGNME